MRYGFYIILCISLAMAGCSSSEKYGPPVTALGGNDVSSANNARKKPVDEQESPMREVDEGPDQPEHGEVVFLQASHNRMPATDPGAVWLVQKIEAALDGREHDSPVWIGTHKLRNQSRAQCDEFDAMLARLAELLDAAGAEQNLRFTSNAAQAVAYDLKGTAYLVTFEGFDLWEMYLSIKPSDRAWTLWQAEAPIRLLRSERLRGQQLFPPQDAPR